MDEQPTTVFRFTAEGVDLEFAGSEAFVEKQVERFRRFLEGSVGAAPQPIEAPPSDSTGDVETNTPETESLQTFYSRCPVRTGRGAIQDHILLFFHYMENRQDRAEGGTSDMAFCFAQLGMDEPKNLSHHLGQLKRGKGYLQEGSRRGQYSLSPAGRAQAVSRFGTL